MFGEEGRRELEQKMDAVLEELVNVRKQPSEIESRQEKKTVKGMLSGAVEKLDQQCRHMKQQIFEVKAEVRAKAGEIITTVRWKGKAALNKVSEFLGIKEKLKNIRRNVQESIAEVDKSIEKIDVFGMGMRKAGQKIANTFRTVADKPQKEYGGKKFSKTELLKKPFQAKRKMLISILNCSEAVIEKAERLAADVRQYQLDKAKRKIRSVANMEAINPIELAKMAEPEFQYGAEAFEAHQREGKAMTKDNTIKDVFVKSGKTDREKVFLN